MNNTFFKFDVGLSFAGEQRDFVEKVKHILVSRGVRVFYDLDEKVQLWGKDLYSELHEIFRSQCRYCVLFASKEYASKEWPELERISAQERALKDKDEYILPVRIDDTKISGLSNNILYINADLEAPEILADAICQKVNIDVRQEYLPPVLDRLYEVLEIDSAPELQKDVESIAHHFLSALRRTTPEERAVLYRLFRLGCPAELPDNIHIDTDLLSRSTGHSVPRLKQILGGLKSLGFACSFREHTDEEDHLHGEALGESYRFVLTWDDYSYLGDLPSLIIADAMVNCAAENYCEEHGAIFFERLDFSQLSSATATRESVRSPSLLTQMTP